MIALVHTVAGTWAVDVDEDVLVEGVAASLPVPAGEPPPLPRVVAWAREGATVVSVVDARPPLAVSHDAGATWREAGGGLPAGRAVAIAPDDPDLVVYAARNRLYVSRDGGRFWRSLTPELPEIEAVALVAADAAG